MTKKICYILDHYEKKTSRHFGYVYNLIQELGKKNDVYVIVEKCFGEHPKFNNVKKTYIQKINYPVIRRLELFLMILYYRFLGCTIFYNHYSYYGAIISGLITKIGGGKSYFWHCIVIEKFMANVHKTSMSKFVFKLRLTLACIFASHLAIGSEVMGEHYKKILGLKNLKPVVLPNWTDPEMFNPKKYDRNKLRKDFGYKPEDKVIFYLHGMEKGKGPQFLPKIVEGIAAKRKDVKFLFAGDGSYRKCIQKEIEDMGLSSLVNFPGQILHQDIPSYFVVADMFIMPSLFEAFSRCLLEAMAMGLPFVATDGGCGGTYAYTPKEQHPFIISADDINKLPSLVLQILDDPELSKHLSSLNLNFVKYYYFDMAIKRFEEKVLS
jgi:glycosyltransferase involved in cell wall biosynthesis